MKILKKYQIPGPDWYVQKSIPVELWLVTNIAK